MFIFWPSHEHTSAPSESPVEHGLLFSTSMTPPPKKPVAEPEREKPEDVDFAVEAGPKETELGTEKDAKDLTAGGFDPIP